MPTFYWFWVSWLLTGLTYEVWAIWFRTEPYDTLSEFTGYVFRTESTWGWTALLSLMTFLAAWYPQHVRDLQKKGKIK